MTSKIAQKIRTFDRLVLAPFVPWHLNTWNRPGS